MTKTEQAKQEKKDRIFELLTDLEEIGKGISDKEIADKFDISKAEAARLMCEWEDEDDV